MKTEPLGRGFDSAASTYLSLINVVTYDDTACPPPQLSYEIVTRLSKRADSSARLTRLIAATNQLVKGVSQRLVIQPRLVNLGLELCNSVDLPNAHYNFFLFFFFLLVNQGKQLLFRSWFLISCTGVNRLHHSFFRLVFKRRVCCLQGARP